MGAAGGQGGRAAMELREIAPGVGGGKLARAAVAAYDGLPFGGVKI